MSYFKCKIIVATVIAGLVIKSYFFGGYIEGVPPSLGEVVFILVLAAVLFLEGKLIKDKEGAENEI